MKNGDHLINRTTIEVTTNKGPAKFDSFENFKKLFYDKLVAIIDEELSQYQEKSILKIDQLVIDLGAFNVSNDKDFSIHELNDIEAKFRATFNSQLKSSLSKNHPKKSYLDLLKEFLISGNTSNDQLLGKLSPAAILKQLSKKEMDALTAFISKNGTNKNLLKRLVYQFTQEELKPIIKSLFPQYNSYHLEVVNFHSAFKKNIKGISKEELEERFLIYLLDNFSRTQVETPEKERLIQDFISNSMDASEMVIPPKKLAEFFQANPPNLEEELTTQEGIESLREIKLNSKDFSTKEAEFEFILDYLITEGALPEAYFKLTKMELLELLLATIAQHPKQFKAKFKKHANLFNNFINKFNPDQRNSVLNELDRNYIKEKQWFFDLLDRLVATSIITPYVLVNMEKLIAEISLSYLLDREHTVFEFDEQLTAEILEKSELKLLESNMAVQNFEDQIKRVFATTQSTDLSSEFELLSENYTQEKKKFLALLEGLIKAGILQENSAIKLDRLIDEISLPRLLTSKQGVFKLDKRLIAEIIQKSQLKMINSKSLNTKELITHLLKKLLSNEKNTDLELLSANYVKEKEKFLAGIERLVKVGIIHKNSAATIDSLMDEICLPLLLTTKERSFKLDKILIVEFIQKSQLKIVYQNSVTPKNGIDYLLKNLLLNESNKDLEQLNAHYLKERKRFLDAINQLVQAKIISANSIKKMEGLIDEICLPFLLKSNKRSFKLDKKLTKELLKKAQLELVEQHTETFNLKGQALNEESDEILNILKSIPKESTLVPEDPIEVLPKIVNLSETFIENLILYIFQHEKLPWWGTQEVSAIFTGGIEEKENQLELLLNLIQQLKRKSNAAYQKVIRQLLNAAPIRSSILWAENEELPALLINAVLPTYYQLPIHSFFKELDGFLAKTVGAQYRIDKLFHQLSDILLPHFLTSKKLDTKKVYSTYFYAYSLALKMPIGDFIKIIQSNRIEFNALIDLQPAQIELLLNSVPTNIVHQEELLNGVFSVEEMAAIQTILVAEKEIEQAFNLLIENGFVLKDAVLLEEQFFSSMVSLAKSADKNSAVQKLRTVNELSYPEVLALKISLQKNLNLRPSKRWQTFATENIQQLEVLKKHVKEIGAAQVMPVLIQNFIRQNTPSTELFIGPFEQELLEKTAQLKLATFIHEKGLRDQIEIGFANQHFIKTVVELKNNSITASTLSSHFSLSKKELQQSQKSEGLIAELSERSAPLKIKSFFKKLAINSSSTFTLLQIEGFITELHQNELELNSNDLKVTEQLLRKLTVEKFQALTLALNLKVIDSEIDALNTLRSRPEFTVFFEELVRHENERNNQENWGRTVLKKSLGLMDIQGIDAVSTEYYFEHQQGVEVGKELVRQHSLNKIEKFIAAEQRKTTTDLKVEYAELIEQFLNNAKINAAEEQLIVESLVELSFESIEEVEVLELLVKEITETITEAEEEVLDKRLKLHKESIAVLLRSLEHFFIYGALPWWSPYANTEDFQNYFNRLYNNNRGEIYKLLKETFSEKEVFNSLTEYIDTYGMDKVLKNEALVLQTNLMNFLTSTLDDIVPAEVRPQIDWLIKNVMLLNGNRISEDFAKNINDSIMQYTYGVLNATAHFNEEVFLQQLKKIEDEKTPTVKLSAKSAFNSILTVQQNIEKNEANFQTFNLEFKQLLQHAFPEKEARYSTLFQKIIAQEVLTENFDEKTVTKILVGFTYYLGLMEQKAPTDVVLKLIRNSALTDLKLFNTLLDISDDETFEVIKTDEQGFLMLIELLLLQELDTFQTEHINKFNSIEMARALKSIDPKNWSNQLFTLILHEKAKELKLTQKEVLTTFTNSFTNFNAADFLQLNTQIERLKEVDPAILGAEDPYQKKLTALSTAQQKSATAKPQENLMEAVIKELRYNTAFLEDYQENRVDEVWSPSKKEEETDLKHDWIDIKEGDRIFVANAGVILLWPFLKTLFTNLNYLEKGLFKDRDAQERAIHILQYIVDGEEKTPEFILMLNKVMCGVPVSEPIKINIKLSTEEKEEAAHFLDTVKNQWKEMKNTSIDVFRDTFLKREGAIHYENEKWFLKVEHQPIDILLTKLPWGLAMIKFSWVKYRILVEWNAKN
jgi:hypothetical protein